MEEVADRLYVGHGQDCGRGGEEWAVVHACKHPCHQNAVGYSGSLPQDHPEYLMAERGDDLYLNLVDMERPLAHEFTAPIVAAALEFIEERVPRQNVLIHCNQGRSRSPALALLYLAKRDGAVPAENYQAARASFEQRYPRYDPGNGVETYLREYWRQFE